MIVVLDSSVLCADLRLAGSTARVFFGNLQVVPATVIVPAVVVDEVVNHFREQLAAAEASLRKAHRELGALVSRPSPTLQPVPVDQEVDTYRRFLVNQVTEAGGRIVPYPEIKHEEVVQRDLQRRKPFKQNGAGYRDLLIWESIRRLMYSGHERVAFATANIRDFAAGSQVHEDLSSDILNPERIELFPSVKSFNEKHVLPRLAKVDEFHRKLRAADGGMPNLADWIREHLLEILGEWELGCVVAPIPDGVGHFWAREVVSFDDMDARAIRRLSDGQIVCQVVVSASVDVSIDIDAEDYEYHREVREWLGGPNIGSWNEVFLLAISMEIIVGSAASTVSSYEIENVEVA